jgi:hypothetical protein
LALSDIRSGATIASDWCPSLNAPGYKLPDVKGMKIIYGGDKSIRRQGVEVISWNDF